MENLFLATATPQGGMLGVFMPFLLMIVLFYIMMYIPEKKRKKKYGDMLSSLSLNDEIITKGGILGKVVNIQDTFIILETGPNRARIKLDKNGILSVLQSTSKEEDNIEKENKKDEENKEVGYKEN
ncbi:preprotein translocase subunit YajC [Clostridium tetani]|nr:preprotein translocase subunit YajC [Clostridium tetani]WFN61485.1 preprotein translocase subunit YajC [Clostridium tetani]SJZ65108.1 protein translocase subunit yajC [Clostridium tetani]SUY57231.1 preprotein translocase subunit YajC [Clostridium tetani]SUY67258.1 preprotein translocase subunit YajC [Clostridium tetani]BDR65136.1 preprotein translocase subunit YajC [Clostridium tetani]